MVALPNAPRAASDAAPASVPGFAIRLPSAQLADLIQINCINRIHGAFRVSSSAGEGYLFFHDGLLVHATCGEQVGLDAVVGMLGWRSGSVDPCAPPWPVQVSIGMGADALLLCAAQQLDERARRAAACDDLTTKVVRRIQLPDEATAHESVRTAPAAATDREPEPALVPVARVDAPQTARAAAQPVARASEHSGLRATLPFESLARLDVTRVTPDGEIQTSRIGASTELADTAFFCQRLASAIGEGLGLGACRALACESAREGVVVFKGRSIVGVRGQRQDLELVLAKVGLG